MRKTVHLCLSSHDEVMYRNEADLVMGFNCLALAILETESRLLAEGFLTTHRHELLQTDNHKEVIRRERYAYSRYFNSKYGRKGRLGERECFSLEVDGLFHLQAAANYVLRQSLHHGITTTPFEYPHGSANSFFRKELGKDRPLPLLSPNQYYKYLPHGKSIPDGFHMAANGLILREEVLDTAYVEQIYITPRNFLYQMNRISDEKSIQEQVRENKLPPVTLEVIEKGVPAFDVQKALTCEQGRVNKNNLTDLEMCRIIDTIYLPRVAETVSIYNLEVRRRTDLANAIWLDFQNRFQKSSSNPFFGGKSTNLNQLRRCMAL